MVRSAADLTELANLCRAPARQLPPLPDEQSQGRKRKAAQGQGGRLRDGGNNRYAREDGQRIGAGAHRVIIGSRRDTQAGQRLTRERVSGGKSTSLNVGAGQNQ